MRNIAKEANKILENYRKNNEHIRIKRLELVNKKIPEYRALKERYDRKGIEYMMLNIEKPKNLLRQEKKNELIQMEKNLKKILMEHNLPKNYLEPIYHCSICKDSGIIHGEICECKKKIMTTLSYQISELEETLLSDNFDHFDFEIFRKEKKEKEYMSPNEVMKVVYEVTYRYAHTFHKNSRSILLTGNVGVGKTYLLNCMAKEVLDNGYSVIYQTATTLMKLLFDYYYSSFESKEKVARKYQLLCDVDLLIIDDLGTEVKTDTSLSHFFDLMNDRIQRKKPILISTNLSTDEIRSHYDERIYSRIFGEYEIIKLIGEDLRIRNKEV